MSKPEPIVVIRTDSKKVAKEWAERWRANDKTSDGALVLDGRAFRVIYDTRKPQWVLVYE